MNPDKQWGDDWLCLIRLGVPAVTIFNEHGRERQAAIDSVNSVLCDSAPLRLCVEKKFMVRLFNGCALRFNTRDYWTEDDDKATHFDTAQDAWDCARLHLLNPAQFTVEEINAKTQRREDAKEAK